MHALDVHCFHLFLCSCKLFQIPPECMFQRHCVHCFSLQFQTVSNTFRTHALKTWFSKYSLQFQNRFKYSQNACFRCTLFSSISLQLQMVSDTTRMHVLETLFSLFFSAVPNRFKYLQNACFTTLFSKCSLQFQNRFEYRQNALLQRHCFLKRFFAIPNRFKYHQNASFRDIVFNISSVVTKYHFKQRQMA